MSKIVYLTGRINWAKVQTPDEKYDVYTLDLYPDDESWVKFRESGMQLKEREGDEGSYIKLRRPTSKKVRGELVDMGKPGVFLVDGEKYNPFAGLVGNGSEGICKVRVYETDKGPGHELQALAITNLIEFAPMEGEGEFPF